MQTIKKILPVFLIMLFIVISMLLASPANTLTAAPETIDVPSGVPTEAEPTPVKLGVPDTTLTVRGCAAPSAFVTLFDDNQPIGTVIAAASGRFNKTIIGQKYGLHTIKAFYEDASERTSSSVSKNISLATQANTDIDIFLPPTIAVNPSSLLVGDLVTFRGTTVPGGTVNVTIDNNTTVVAVANNLGNWLVSVDTENFFIGTHVFQAVSARDDCGTSEPTERQSFSVRRPTAEEFLREPIERTPTPPVINEPSDRFLASNPGVLILGTSLPNSQLEIWIDGSLEGSVFANAQGEWSFPLTMRSDQHTIIAKMCVNGECSADSNSVTVFYSGDFEGCSIEFKLKQYRFHGLQPGAGIDLELKNIDGSGRYEVLIDWGNTSIEHFSLYRDSQTRFHHVFHDSGQFNGIVTIEDSDNCIYTQYISVEVLDRPSLNWWWLSLLAVPPLLVVGYRTTKHLHRIRVRYVN